MTYLIGSTAEESARAMNALQDALVGRFKPAWEAEIRRAMLEMTEAYEATRSVPSIPPEHEARMAEIWANMTAVAVNAFGNRVLDQGKAMGKVLETKSFAEFFARLALEYIASEIIRARITAVSNTLRQQIINVILAGQAEGQPTPEIVTNLRVLSVTIPRYRADMIARTEVHGAANYGANEAAKATGLTLRKEWVSVEDTRTRAILLDDEFDHRVMNGVVVDMDQPFMVPRSNGTKEPLMVPGDPSGSAANVINCRCAIAHQVVDD